jgi:DNA-directed RNA polymerase specialized sigma24 family protein
MPATDAAPSPDRSPAPPPEVVRAAFLELHGRRLHGFAQLLTLGDRPLAARLTSDALAAGADRIDELRHPERAAAWLRRRVVERSRARRAMRGDARVLLDLAADEPTVEALAALGRLERAALVASAVERLDRRDVAAIVGRDGEALDRLLRRARERFMRAHAGVATGEPPVDGPIATRVRAIARRAMA